MKIFEEYKRRIVKDYIKKKITNKLKSLIFEGETSTEDIRTKLDEYLCNLDQAVYDFGAVDVAQDPANPDMIRGSIIMGPIKTPDYVVLDFIVNQKDTVTEEDE